jgi:hypothetical protein
MGRLSVVAVALPAAEAARGDDEDIVWLSWRPATAVARSHTASGNPRGCHRSTRSCTALASLLTFCSLGPEARIEALLDQAVIEDDIAYYRYHGALRGDGFGRRRT